MTALDLDALERVARAATPGPWFVTGSPWFRDATGVLAGSPDGNIAFVIADCEAIGVEREEYEGPFKLADPEADAAYIAAIDPQTALALISRLRAAEAREREARETIDAMVRAGVRGADELSPEQMRERCAAEAESLGHTQGKAVAARIRWLSTKALTSPQEGKTNG